MSETESDGIDWWGQRMPVEILLKIFQYCVKFYGSIPLLLRTSQVSILWRRVSLSPSLWDRVDFSSGWINRDVLGLRDFCRRQLSTTTQFNLTTWKLADVDLKVIAENCQSIERLNLSHCEKITALGMRDLAIATKNLKHLNLSFVSPLATSKTSLMFLVQNLGPGLHELILDGNYLGDHFSSVLQKLSAHCCNLRVLSVCCELSDCSIALDVERLQWGCPRLTVLNLKRSKFDLVPTTLGMQVLSPGFPLLNEFTGPLQMRDDFLLRILKHSTQLLFLDVQESMVSDVGSLPCGALDHLIAPRDETCAFQFVHGALAKWRLSLRTLDLSWCRLSSRNMDRLLCNSFFSLPFDRLYSLDLCGTLLSYNGLRAVLSNCGSLHLLNLLFCSLVPLDMRREFEGVKSKRELINLVDYG